MVNQVQLIGNLGDDVKLHHFENGGIIGRFPLATSESWKDKESQEKKTRTEWHNVVVKNKVAELCDKYLSKGKRVFVSGSIRYRKWQTEDGQDRYSTEIHVRDIKFLSPSEGAGNKTSNSAGPTPENEGGENDDLPF